MTIEGGSAFPGARNLAHDTGLHEHTIRLRLNELVEGEWLAVVERGGLPGEERRRIGIRQSSLPPMSDHG
jgi:DNA-binding transcriptional regulator YhcF (GntR family)